MKNALRFDVKAMVDRYALPLRLRAEITTVCDGNLDRVLSRTRISNKAASFKTQERRVYTICRSFQELRDLRFKIESAHSLAGKHIAALVEYWVGAEQEGGTIENKLSHLRAFCEWMGKRGVVKPLDDYVDRREAGLVRSYVTTTDKSWIAAGVDAAAKIAEIAREYPRVAVQLKLQAAFGLRIEESFSLKPASALLNLDTLRISHGTKGGREREVPTQLRLAVLEEAMGLVDPARGSTTPAHYTIARWRGHYNFVLSKFGISKKGLGVTSHGLRHQWLQEYYESLTGVPAPVKGSAERAPVEAHRVALLSAVEAAGHSKPSKTGAYLSTYAAMEKTQVRRVTKQEAEEMVRALNGNKSLAAERLGVSRPALYRALGRTY